MARTDDLQTPCGRSFKSALSEAFVMTLFQAALSTRYRGALMIKNALDLVLYMRVLEQLQPVTVIEVGAHHGGSALWFADMIAASGRKPHIVSIDLDPPVHIADDRIRFIKGNALDLGAVLRADMLESLPRPWLVSEDSAHIYETSRAVLDFFKDKMAPGETIVVEDGVVGHLSADIFQAMDNGPNRAVAAFLAEHGNYEVNAGLCDLFGYNATFNPNGWLKRKD